VGVTDTARRARRVLEFPEGLAETASACFVYRLYAADGTLLYVGSTGNLLGRLGSHAADKIWASRVVSVRVEAFTERDAALQAEREAVRREKPAQNSVLYIVPDGMTANEVRQIQKREARKGRMCTQCAQRFDATRSDSKTCSSRCRQKAYRDRNKAAPSTTGRVASRAVYENIHSMN